MFARDSDHPLNSPQLHLGTAGPIIGLDRFEPESTRTIEHLCASIIGILCSKVGNLFVKSKKAEPKDTGVSHYNGNA